MGRRSSRRTRIYVGFVSLFSKAFSFVFSLFVGNHESVTGDHKVKVLEVCAVLRPPTRLRPCTLPLTFLDVFLLRVPPNKRLFFYECPQSTDYFTYSIIPKLKHSLCFTLKNYFPLSGNLTWPQNSLEPFIETNGCRAVSFTVAESQAKFYHLTGKFSLYREAHEHDSLLPVLKETNTKVPVMALQVTVFPNAGFCIGYAIHHVAMDEKTTGMFMHTWASTCMHISGSTYRQNEDPTPKPKFTPSYDKSTFKSQTQSLQVWMDQGGPNNKSVKPWDLKASGDTMYGTFVLIKESMDQIKNWVSKRCQEKHEEEPNLSTYTIATAFVWVCLARAQRLRVEKTSLLISLDVREMLYQIVPVAYFGSCVLFSMAEAKTEDLMGEDGVLIAAQAITEVLKRTGERVFDGVHEWINRLFSMQTKGLYSVSDASSFKHYKIDFGWGLPMKVDLASIDKCGAFSISDCRDTDGVEVGVALAPLDIEIFSNLFSTSF